MDNIARIFVGTDRSQRIGVKVLEFSIRKHSSVAIDLRPMDDLVLPEPDDPRQSQRTGFSFCRFAIPELAGYRGKAVYLDADMLVFRDFAELWDIPFDGAKVVIQDDLPEHAQRPGATKGAPAKRIKQCAVMLLDCGRLDWNVKQIVHGLGRQYSYEELVYQLCILKPAEISYRVPFEWNSLEHFDEKTALLHYTDMQTQPWVAPENPLGYLWVGHLKEMLDCGAISQAEIEEDVAGGYARPSLCRELEEVGGSRPLTAEEIERYQRMDEAARFVRHKAVYEAKRRRNQAIQEYERKLASKAPAAARESKPDGWLARFLGRLASSLDGR
jgi:lipopolysaccharide biosynthesis glycosyltransferase